MPKAVEYMGVKIKLCPKCNEFKKVEEFNRNKRTSDGLNDWCRECSHEADNRWRDSNPERYWVLKTLNNHRRRGFRVEIAVDVLVKLAKTTKTCPLCGCELVWSYDAKNGRRNSCPTLDRIDNGKALTFNNVQIICNRCNATKYDRTMKEFVEYCKTIADSYSYMLEVKA